MMLDQRRVEIERHPLAAEERVHTGEEMLERPVELLNVAEVEAGEERPSVSSHQARCSSA